MIKRNCIITEKLICQELLMVLSAHGFTSCLVIGRYDRRGDFTIMCGNMVMDLHVPVGRLMWSLDRFSKKHIAPIAAKLIKQGDSKARVDAPTWQGCPWHLSKIT